MASATPWGNHTPAHPADYKTWGEPDEDPSGGGGGGGGGSEGRGSTWAEDNSVSAPPPWDADQGRRSLYN